MRVCSRTCVPDRSVPTSTAEQSWRASHSPYPWSDGIAGALVESYPETFGVPPRMEAHHKVEAHLELAWQMQR